MIRKICRFLVCGMLVIVFVGCTPISVLPTITVHPLPTSASTIVPTATSIPLTATSQPLNFFYPKVEKRCPENRDVSLDKLGIGVDTRIILNDLSKTGLWGLDPLDSSPELIQELPLDKWLNVSINSDGRIMAYTIWNPDYSTSTWVYILQSGEQHEIMNIDYLEGASSSAKWLSQNDLTIIGSCPGSGCPFPLNVIDVSTGEVLDIRETDRNPYDTYLGVFEDNGKYYALYTAGNVGDDYYYSARL